MSRTYKSPSQETSPKDDTSNASQELHKGLTFSAFCKSFRKKCLEKALIDSNAPSPTQAHHCQDALLTRSAQGEAEIRDPVDV